MSVCRASNLVEMMLTLCGYYVVGFRCTSQFKIKNKQRLKIEYMHYEPSSFMRTRLLLHIDNVTENLLVYRMPCKKPPVKRSHKSLNGPIDQFQSVNGQCKAKPYNAQC